VEEADRNTPPFLPFLIIFRRRYPETLSLSKRCCKIRYIRFKEHDVYSGVSDKRAILSRGIRSYAIGGDRFNRFRSPAWQNHRVFMKLIIEMRYRRGPLPGAKISSRIPMRETGDVRDGDDVQGRTKKGTERRIEVVRSDDSRA